MANRINVVLGIDTGPFERSLNAVSKRMQRFGQELQNAGSMLTQAITIPLAGIGAASLKSFAELEKLNKGLVAIMGTSELAADELSKLREVARLPGLGLKEAVQGSVNLQAVGLSADEARNTMLGFGKALAATGKGKFELEAIQYQLTQMISKNKLLAEDYKVIQSNLPLMAKGMEAAFGTNNIELIRETGISAKEFTLRLSAALGSMKETQNVSGGLANSFENLQDSVFIASAQFGAAINKSLNLEGFLNKLGAAVQRAADWFSSLSPSMQKIIVIAAGVAAALGPVLFVLGKLVAVGPVLVTGLKAIGTAFTFMTGPVGIAIAAIGAIVAGVVYAYNKFEGFRRVVNGLGNTFKELITIIKEGASAFIRGFAELKEGEFKKAAKSFEEGIRKTNPVTLAFTEGKRLRDAFSDGFADDTNYLKKVQKEFAAATSGKLTAPASTLPGALPTAPGGGSGDAKKDFVSFESQAQAVFLRLRQSAADLQTKAVNAFISPLANIEALESPLKKTEAFFKSWQESVRLAGDQLAVFGGDQLAIVQAQLQTTGNYLSQAVEQFGVNSLAVEQLSLQYDGLKTKLEELAAVQEYAAKVQNAFASAWEAGASAVNQAGATIKSVLKAVGRAALQAAADIVKAEIIKGVASVIADSLQKFGLLGLAIAGAAGAAAGALFQTAINKIAPPKLARGGLVTREQLVTVGDNPSGKEAIIPFERMDEFLNMAGGGGATRVTGLFEVRGSDLILVLDRAKQEQIRVR